MFEFSLILPAGLTFISFLNVVLFIMLIFLLPGSLFLISLQRAGIKTVNGKRKVNASVFSKKVTGFILYHLFMLVVWIISWPQFTNPVHTGYGWDGIPYYLLVMLVWTITGGLVIYAWNLAQNAKVRFPGIGFFIRLYLWNLAIMFIFRQLIYWFIT